jgi:hypothetical protein
MSAEPERLFSGAKITISDRRSRLHADTIQALHYLKSWLGIEYMVDDDIEDDGMLGANQGGGSMDVSASKLVRCEKYGNKLHIGNILGQKYDFPSFYTDPIRYEKLHIPINTRSFILGNIYWFHISDHTGGDCPEVVSR